MAITDVKLGLHRVFKEVENAEEIFKSCKERIVAARDKLENIPIRYADLEAEIGAFTGADIYEKQCAEELSRLADQFNALKTEMTALIGHF